MKKQANRLIALLISLVMLLSMLPVGHIPVHAEEVADLTETPAQTEAVPQCICGGAAAGAGEHVCSEITWSPWADGERYNSGAYYLTENVTLGTAINVTNLSLDLRGHTLTLVGPNTSAKQIFVMKENGTLNICDSVGGGSLVAYSAATGTQGTLVNSTVAGATINLFGGTFDASGIVASNQQGVGFNITGGSTLNLYGGTIIGGATTNYGGAVYVNGGSSFTMYGGEIYGGTAANGGNNLFVGGNANGTVKLLGGTVYGGVHTTGKTVSIGGDIRVLETLKNGEAASYGLWVKDGNAVTVQALNDDACVYLDKNTNTNAAVFGTDVTAQAYGQIRVGAYTVNTVALTYEDVAYVLSGSALKLGEGKYHCLCGQETHIGDCDGKVLVWTPWKNETITPYGSGNYYLAGNVTATAAQSVAANGVMNLDLNGHSITNATTNVYNLDSADALNITDTAGGGSITATGKHVANVTGVNSAFSLYGGTLQSTVTTVNANGGNAKNVCSVSIYGGTIIGGSASWGGAVYINNGASLKMTGGTVYGGTAATNGDNIFIGGGANPSYITGGTVYGGPNMNAVVTTGGMLYIGGSAKVLDHLNDENKTAANGLAVNATKIKILPLNVDAEIRFMGAAGTKVAALDSTTENKNYAQLLGAGDELVALPNESGELILTAGKLHCLCSQSEHIGDCTGEVLLWKPWTSTTLPTATGNYYLTADITDGGQAVPVANAVINLDLNGKSFMPKLNTASAAGNYVRPYVLEKEGAVLNITDSVGGGKICGGVRGDAGLVVRITKAATLNLYAGTLDGSTSKETTSATMMGTVQLHTDSNGVFNMYGGKVVGISENPTHFKDGAATGTAVSTPGSAVYAAANTTFNHAGGDLEGDVYIQLEITWVVDGELSKTYVEKGAVPTKAKPSKEDADGYSYTFKGWSLTENGEALEAIPAATENTTYYAVFSANLTSAAKVGDTYYATFEEALAAADGNTVVLLQDVTVAKTTTIAEGKDITIDLNGHSIKAGESYPVKSTMFSVAGKLTICDSVGTGSIDASAVTASQVGGVVIQVNKATGEVVLNSGKIIGGATNNFGGAVYVNSGAKFTMNGGVISGGSAAQKGNTLFVGGNPNGSVQLLGGTIYGGAWTTGNTVSIGGSVKILQTLENGEAAAYGLKVDGSNTVTVLALTEDAQVYLDKATGLNNVIAVFGENVTANDYEQLIAGTATVSEQLSNVEGSGIHLIDGKLYLTAGQWDCLCRQDEHTEGCSGEDSIFWRAWTSGNSLPTSGSYYLTTDVAEAVQTNVGGKLNLDLNGHSVRVGQNPGAAVEGGTYNSYRVLYMTDDTDVLNITDSVGGGKLYAGKRHDAGHIVYLLDCEATFNLHAGTLTAEELEDTNGKKGNISGVVYSTEGGTFNMYGGEIIGWNGLTHVNPDQLAEDGFTFVSGTGASVTFAGTFNMYGGIIRGGNAIPGNAGSTGDGGNVFMLEDSVFNMYGGTITGGKAQYGGNVFIAAGATYNYVGGTIENGTALIYGNDVFCVEESELIYTVTFVDANGEVLKTEQLYRGAFPEYEGIVTKAPSGAVTYEHIGWNPGMKVVTEDVTYVPVFQETVHDIRVDQWNLTLKDNIDVNFHVYIAENLIETAEVKITVGSGAPVSYKVSELTVNAAGAYEFVAEVAAAQMTDTITLELVNGEEVCKTLTYSVEQYAEAVLADEAQASYHAIVKEMLNYGAAAQVYFGHNAEDLAGADVDLTGTGASSIADAQVSDMVITGKEEGIAFYGASLVFRSKIAVRFYFTGDISGYEFEGATVGQKNELSYVEFAEINPQDLDEAITVTVGGISVTYGPMNYMARMSVNGSENLQALLNALYNYHLAAEAIA